MADVTLPSSFFATGDETIAALDRLHQTDQARRADQLRVLQASVAGLDGEPSIDFESTPDVRPRERPAAPYREPYVRDSFERSTPGGPPGPAVRRRLREVALEKESRRW